MLSISDIDLHFSFLALTEKTLQQVSFVEFIGCMLNICLLGYYVIMVREQDTYIDKYI